MNVISKRRGEWIGQDGKMKWLSGSDLATNDFYFWDTLENIIYKKRSVNIEEPKEQNYTELDIKH